MDQPPVELHIVSDSTGETAARLVLALEAQFPEQAFEEVRHTRAETVADLERAVRSARGHAAVVIFETRCAGSAAAHVSTTAISSATRSTLSRESPARPRA